MDAPSPLTRLRIRAALLCALGAFALFLAAPATRAAHSVPLSEIPPRAYVVATYDGSTLRLYLNAVLAAQTPVSGPIDKTTAPLEIGSYAGGAIWSGAIDDVAVYDRALPAATVTARYKLGINPNPPSPNAYSQAVLHTPGLVSYWPLDDRGPVAKDVRGHNNGVFTPGVGKGAEGLISGETGNAIALNGRLGSVKVPPSHSLDLRRAFTIEAWVTTVHVANRHIVSRVGSWFLKTNAFGQWSTGVYVNGTIVSATSRFVAHGPLKPGAAKHSSSSAKSGDSSPSLLWLLIILVLAAVPLAVRWRRRTPRA